MRPWYQYRWDELEPHTFRYLGLVARRAPDGSPRFNLPQTVWLDAFGRMDWAPVRTFAGLTLAVNVLTAIETRMDRRAFFGTTSRRVLRLAPRFADDVLLTMPPSGGQIPMDLIREYLRERP